MIYLFEELSWSFCLVASLHGSFRVPSYFDVCSHYMKQFQVILLRI